MTSRAGTRAPRAISLNLNVRGLGPSATLASKARCRALRAEGREVFDFGLGQSPFPVPDPVVRALQQAAAERDYLPIEGLPALREAVAGFHRRKDGLEARTEGVLVGPGSKELMFLLQLVFYGEIILRSPCWVSYLPQAQILGRRITVIPTSFDDAWKITPALLHDSFAEAGDDGRPRLLVMNYPSNPTGHTYTADELGALAEVARAFDLIVLSDEIYAQTQFLGDHISIARYCPERTIVSSGLSKWCGAGGWRLGTFMFPPELDWLKAAMSVVASETYTSVSAPIQHAAVQAFRQHDEIEAYLVDTRRVLSAIADRTVQVLQDGGLRVRPPAGAFYVFVDFGPYAGDLARRGIRSSDELCDQLLSDTGVAVLAGVHFGRPLSELTARLSFVDFDGRGALETSGRLAGDPLADDHIVGRHAGQLLVGLERIVAWARS